MYRGRFINNVEYEWGSSQLEPFPAVALTDIHANHNRNERPRRPTTTVLPTNFNGLQT